MWLIALLILKWNPFLLEAAILHGNQLVTRWLLGDYWLMTLLMMYLIKEDTDLGKNSDLLLDDAIFCCLCDVTWSPGI